MKVGPPRNKKDLQKLLGMINYVRTYVPNLSHLSHPLRELLKGDVAFKWLPHHDKCLEKTLKAVEQPKLSHKELMYGLRNEIADNSEIQEDWELAEAWCKKMGWRQHHEFHMALYAYTCDSLYKEFNAVSNIYTFFRIIHCPKISLTNCTIIFR